MSEENNIKEKDVMALDDDMLEKISAGISFSKNEDGFTVYDKEGNVLAFFANKKEMETFAQRLASVVGRQCGGGLGYYLPK